MINEEGMVTVPEDTVVQELKSVSGLFEERTEDLAMAMAVYMLGFHTYSGFAKGEKEPFIGTPEGMLKRIYEYGKRMII